MTASTSSASTLSSSIRPPGLRLPRIQDDATRRAVIRAYNIVSADYFSGLGDRLTPAAIIPMHTPDEAIAELEFVTKQLGSKVGMFGSNMARKVPAAAANDPDTARFAVWYDVLGLDSEYDYDPVWAKCVELGIAPTFHSASQQPGPAAVADQFHLQPYRPFRRGRPCDRQGDLPRRRDPALPAIAVCLSRRRRRLGLAIVRRSDRALGAAQRQGVGAHASRTSSTAPN